MSTFPPPAAGGPEPERAHASLGQRELDAEERRRVLEVRAAAWRARELAASVFGEPVRTALHARARREPPRGLLRIDVPFDELAGHRLRERAFMAAVHVDPLLSEIPLVYVLGPVLG